MNACPNLSALSIEQRNTLNRSRLQEEAARRKESELRNDADAWSQEVLDVLLAKPPMRELLHTFFTTRSAIEKARVQGLMEAAVFERTEEAAEHEAVNFWEVQSGKTGDYE